MLFDYRRPFFDKLVGAIERHVTGGSKLELIGYHAAELNGQFCQAGILKWLTRDGAFACTCATLAGRATRPTRIDQLAIGQRHCQKSFWTALISCTNAGVTMALVVLSWITFGYKTRLVSPTTLLVGQHAAIAHRLAANAASPRARFLMTLDNSTTTKKFNISIQLSTLFLMT